MKIKVLHADYKGEIYNYSIHHIERDKSDPDYCPIDFEVRDAYDGTLMATVWGDKDDLSIDCEHYAIEMDDIDECGKCEICGADVHWHEENNQEDEERVGRFKVVDEYDPIDKPTLESIIGMELNKIIKKGE